MKILFPMLLLFAFAILANADDQVHYQDARSILESVTITKFEVESASVQEVIDRILFQCAEIAASRGESPVVIDSLVVPARQKLAPTLKGSVTGEFGPASAWKLLEFHGSMCGFAIHERADGKIEFRTEPKQAAN